MVDFWGRSLFCLSVNEAALIIWDFYYFILLLLCFIIILLFYFYFIIWVLFEAFISDPALFRGNIVILFKSMFPFSSTFSDLVQQLENPKNRKPKEMGLE